MPGLTQIQPGGGAFEIPLELSQQQENDDSD